MKIWSFMGIVLLCVVVVLSIVFAAHSTPESNREPAHGLKRPGSHPVPMREDPPGAASGARAVREAKPEVLTTAAPSKQRRTVEEGGANHLRVEGRVTDVSGRFVPGSHLQARWISGSGTVVGEAHSALLEQPTYRLAVLRPGKDDARSTEVFEMHVSAPDHVAAWAWIAVPSSVRALEIDVELIRGTSTGGTVVSARDGAPLAGVLVDARPEQPRRSKVRMGPPGGLGWAEGVMRYEQHGAQLEAASRRRTALYQELTHLTTAEDGRFEFDPVNTDDLTLQARLEDHLTYFERGIVATPGTVLDELIIALERGATLHGRLVTADGEPVVNTPVTATRLFESALLARGLATTGVHHGMVDWSGEFEITGLEPGEYEVSATPPGHSPSAARVIVPTVEPFELVLGESCGRRILLAGEGVRPHSRAKVSMRGSLDTGHPAEEVVSLRVCAPTEATGLAYLDLPGTAFELESVVVSLQGFTPTLVEAPACGESVTVTMLRPGLLHGTVTDQHGQAIPGARISITPLQLDIGIGADLVRGGPETTNETGFWSIPHWGPGAYRRRISADGCLPEEATLRVESIESQSLGTVRLERALDLRVTVLTPTGEPAPGVTVALVYGDVEAAATDAAGSTASILAAGAAVESGLEGDAIFETLPAGTGWVALVRKGDELPHFRKDVAPDERRQRVETWADGLDQLARPFRLEDGDVNLTLVDHPRPRIRGTTGSLGSLLPAARVDLIQMDAGGADAIHCSVVEELQLDPAGHFSSQPLDPKPTFVVLRAPGAGVLATDHVELQLGQDIHRHLEPRGASLEIVVTDASTGEPVTGATVSARPHDGEPHGPLGPEDWSRLAADSLPLVDCVRVEQGELGESGQDGRLIAPILDRRGMYVLRVTKSGYLEAAEWLLEGSWPEETLEVALEPAARLEVTLLTKLGSQEHFMISLLDPATSRNRPLGMFQGGQHAFDDLRPGIYVLQLHRRVPGEDDELLDRDQVVLATGDAAAQATLDARH